MALTDEDLGQIRGIVREEVRTEVRAEVRKGTEVVNQALRDEFMNFVENNFQPGIDSLQEQIGEVKERVEVVELGVQEIKRGMRLAR